MAQQLVTLTHSKVDGKAVVPESTARMLEEHGGWKRSTAKKDEDPRPTPPKTTS